MRSSSGLTVFLRLAKASSDVRRPAGARNDEFMRFEPTFQRPRGPAAQSRFLRKRRAASASTHTPKSASTSASGHSTSRPEPLRNTPRSTMA